MISWVQARLNGWRIPHEVPQEPTVIWNSWSTELLHHTPTSDLHPSSVTSDGNPKARLVRITLDLVSLFRLNESTIELRITMKSARIDFRTLQAGI